MENAEEVMQLLEEFARIKPKDIPRELEDYLGYVAKTGDPMYQWSLVKHLFREKLLSVLTDFYESTLTVELPPCPNVESFNYERMKTSLLERFDTFSSAPFTVQRICELLTNPRKEYNRADKYMRAIEKNILVVSTREPGTGKRSLECDSQSETVFNGMPDIKVNDSDAGSLLQVATDLPYLGAPPASNDITVETTVNERLGQDINGEVSSVGLQSESDKSWPTQESSSVVTQDTKEECSATSEILDTGVSFRTESQKPSEIPINDSDTIISSKPAEEEMEQKVITKIILGEGSSKVVEPTCESVLPDSINSSEPIKDIKDISQNKLESVSDEAGHVSDENEVSSTPSQMNEDTLLIQEEVEEVTDSEAEATDVNIAQSSELDSNSEHESDINSSDVIAGTGETETISLTITEVTGTDSNTDEVKLECTEITGSMDFPKSPENTGLQSDSIEVLEKNINLEVSLIEPTEHSDLHPDSSNDTCLLNKTSPKSHTSEPCIEADSMSETNIEHSEELKESEFNNDDECQSNAETTQLEVENSVPVTVSSPEVQSNITTDNEVCLDSKVGTSVVSSNLTEDAEGLVSESQCSTPTENISKVAEVQSASEVSVDMCDQEKREDTVIQSVSNVSPDSQQQITIEEISVDPCCEVEEEAMDVDDSSNQMMVSEGENEGEPMDQSDQLQS